MMTSSLVSYIHDITSLASFMHVRGHLQTKIFTLNVIVTLKGGGGSLANEHDVNFEISIARAQKDINSMQVQ